MARNNQARRSQRVTKVNGQGRRRGERGKG